MLDPFVSLDLEFLDRWWLLLSGTVNWAPMAEGWRVTLSIPWAASNRGRWGQDACVYFVLAVRNLHLRRKGTNNMEREEKQ